MGKGDTFLRVNTTAMSDERSSRSLPGVPPEDQALQEAFATLDYRLAAWSSAMTEAIRAIEARSSAASETPEATATASPPEFKTRVENTAPTENPSQDPCGTGISPVCIDERIGIGSKTETASVAAQTNSPAPTQDLTAKAPTESAGKRDVLGRPVAQPGPIEPAAAASDAAAQDQPAKDSDEAMLASLDPETAKAIRIMRRVSPVKRSVKELLEEYQAGRSSRPAAVAPKKSWWTRG